MTEIPQVAKTKPKDPQYGESMQAGYDAGLQQQIDHKLVAAGRPARQLQEAQ